MRDRRWNFSLVLLAAAACHPDAASPSRQDTSAPCAEEIPYDGVDQDCNGSDLSDVDGDGHSYPTDCDDDDPDRHAGADEVPYDGIDQDCDGADADDLDADGYALAQDCDDTDGEIHPGASETCDGIDQDCDGGIDEDASDAQLWYADADGDGFGDAGVTALACTPQGVADATDCDDTDPAIGRGAEEVCGDDADNNCDGYVDQMVAGVTHLTVQEAVDAACADGDTTWVAAGTFVENVVISRSLVLAAEASGEMPVLDGSGCTRGVDVCHVIQVTAWDVTVSGLHITGGHADQGGGVSAEYVLGLGVTGCVVDGNRATSRGGGIFLNGSGTVSGNEISNNESALGGGLYVRLASNDDDGALTVSGNEIAGNLATSGGGGYEKAADGQASWTGNDIRDNTASYGGGLMAEYGLSTSGNTIEDNNASLEGGGIWFYTEWEGSGDTISGNVPDDVWDDGL